MDHPELVRYRQVVARGSCPYVLGVDEVGTGAWAGPFVVCGAVVPVGWPLAGVKGLGLKDSKKLTWEKREALFPILQLEAEYVADFTMPREIDARGLAASLDASFQRVVAALLKRFPGALVVLDGTLHHNIEQPHICLPKADGLVPAVMAASVLGKVSRDREMAEYDALYPGYDFAKSVGYGTAAHQAGLEKLGVSPLHRRSYAPIKKLLSV